MSVPVGRGGPWLRKSCWLPLPGTHQCCSVGIPCLFWVDIEHGRETLVGAINRRPVYNTCFCSVANNFIHCPTADDYGYHAFGELARFIYCLLQKIKQGSSLPLVEQWDEYVLPNHSKFPPISGGEFLAGTRCWQLSTRLGVRT